MTRERKVHAPKPGYLGYTMCWRRVVIGEPLRFSDVPEEVTCKWCKEAMSPKRARPKKGP